MSNYESKEDETVRRVCPGCGKMQDFVIVMVEEETTKHIITRKEERCTVCGGVRVLVDPQSGYRMK